MIFALLFLAVPLDAPSEERVVFHTVAGDLVFVLYPNAAPQTVKQFLQLVRAGVYDTTTFGRVHPGFFAQASPAKARTQPLSETQAALIRPLPLEASELKHVRGTLSLSHPEDDPNGETSFCIMLAPAPHLDGKYTIFGRLERGEDVLNEMLRVPENDQMVPTVRLTVVRAEVFDNAAALAPMFLSPGHPVAGASCLGSSDKAREHALAAGEMLIVLLALMSTFFKRVGKSLNLVIVLVGSFLALVLLVPEGQSHPWLGMTLLLGLVGVFKAMGRFETSPR